MDDAHVSRADSTSTTGDGGRADSTGNSPERVTVSLIPRTANELKALQADTKMSRSDLVNRAVGLYSFVTRQLDSGGELAIHFPDSGETRIVHVT